MKMLSLSNCPLVESQGSGYIVLNFIKGLREMGHEISAFGPEQFEPVPAVRRGKNFRLAWGMAWWALLKMIRGGYQIVEFYGGHAWLAASLLRVIPRRRFLMVNHSNGLEPHCDAATKQFLDHSDGPSPMHHRIPWSRAYTNVDAVVTVSHDERRYALQSRLQDAEHVLALENALPDAFLDSAVELQRPRVILYCGSWLARKGVATIIADMPRVLRQFPDWRFKIIGVGPCFPTNRYFPPELCSRIEIVPFLSDKLALRREYQSARIVVVPSIYESFGLVTAEAMACGCAVVTTNSGFGADLIDGREAVIMRERTAPALYNALSRLMNNDWERAAIALGGHRRVQRLRWKPTVEAKDRAYRHWFRERAQIALTN